jgi:hypothetical protein
LDQKENFMSSARELSMAFSSTAKQQQAIIQLQRVRDTAQVEALSFYAALLLLFTPTIATHLLFAEGRSLFFIREWLTTYFTGQYLQSYLPFEEKVADEQNNTLALCDKFYADIPTLYKIFLKRIPEESPLKLKTLQEYWGSIAAALDKPAMQGSRIKDQLLMLLSKLSTVSGHIPKVLQSFLKVESEEFHSKDGTRFTRHTIMRPPEVPSYLSHAVLGDLTLEECEKLKGIQSDNQKETLDFIAHTAPTLGINAAQFALITLYVTATFPLKYRIVDPLLLKVHKYFFKVEEYTPVQIQRLSHAAAEKYIQELHKKNNALIPVGQSYRIFARLLLPLLCLLGFIKWLSDEKASAEFGILIFTMISLAFNGAEENCRHARKERVRVNNINNLTAQLKILVRGCSQGQWELSENKDYFVLKVNRCENLSAACVARLIRSLLLDKGIAFDTANTTNLIFISSDTKIASEVVVDINSELKTILQHKVDIKRLTKQIYSLDRFAGLEIKHDSDTQGMPLLHAEITVPEQYHDILSLKNLQLIFSGNDITQEANKFVLIGRVISAEKRLVPAITEMERRRQSVIQEVKEVELTSQMPLDKKLKPRKNHHTKTSLTTIVKPVPCVEQKRYPLITFQGEQYDPNDPESLLRPIKRADHGQNSFVLFAIPKEYFPGSMYKKFRDAAKDVSNRSFRHTDTSKGKSKGKEYKTHDIYGRMFTATSKLWSSTEDSRVHGEAKKDDSGAFVIHHMKGLELSSH